MLTIPAHRPAPTQDPKPDLRRAWLCLLLLPVGFIAAFLVGEGLIALLGYPVGQVRPPVWVAVLAGVPAMIVYAIPALLSCHFARRAAQRGDNRGWIPAGILIGLTVLFVLQNTVPLAL